MLEFKIKFCRVNRGVRRLVQPPQQDSGELRERENEETVIREQPRLLHTLVISALFVAQGTSILQFCRTRSTDNFKQKKTITKKKKLCNRSILIKVNKESQNTTFCIPESFSEAFRLQIQFRFYDQF